MSIIQKKIRFVCLRACAVYAVSLLSLMVSCFDCQSEEILLWSEDFQDVATFWQDWHAEGGVWSVGSQYSGPPKLPNGKQVAGTVLSADVPAGRTARLVRHVPLLVPGLDESPMLRLRHWFNVGRDGVASIDFRANGETIELATYANASGGWTEVLVDLASISGLSGQLVFTIESRTSIPGWFLDSVSLLSIISSFDGNENFDGDTSGWFADNGQWEIGTQVKSIDLPERNGEASLVAGTVMSGSYFNNITSTLWSPDFFVPSGMDQPMMRFWSYFSFGSSDSGDVIVKSSDGSSRVVHSFKGWSGDWFPMELDLSSYKGSRIRMGFKINATNSGGRAGWYFDDISLNDRKNIMEFPYQVSDWDGWQANQGGWKFTSGSAYISNSYVANAIQRSSDFLKSLIGNRLISPQFSVPGENVKLRFHYRNTLGSVNVGVLVTELDQDRNWKFSGIGHGFTVISSNSSHFFDLDMSSLSGKRCRLEFVLSANPNQTSSSSGGGISIQKIDLLPLFDDFINPSGFDDLHAIDAWFVDSAAWNFGDSSLDVLPGKNIAGTNLEGFYMPNTSSTLLSPPWIVPDASYFPALRFFHWYRFHSTTDYGVLNLIDDFGVSHELLKVNSSSIGQWENTYFDLSGFAGKKVQLAFKMISDSSGEDAGWYLDDLTLQTSILDHVEDMNISEGDMVTSLIAHHNAKYEARIEFFGAVALGKHIGSFPPTDGLRLDPDLGLLTWSPTEKHGGFQYYFRLGLHDPNSFWNPIDYEDFSITVREVNERPQVLKVPDITFNDERNILFKVIGKDPDVPANQLSYTLEQGPKNSGIDPKSGEGGWLIAEEDRHSIQTFTVRVTDDGEPPLSIPVTFRAIPESLLGPSLGVPPRPVRDSLVLQYTYIKPGVSYRLQFAESLAEPIQWEDLESYTWDQEPFYVSVKIESKPMRFFRLIESE